PASYVGAEPWFIDSDPGTWNMDPALLEVALEAATTEGRRVGAVMAVDLFGQCVDYETVESICGRFGVPLIEDAAESLGSTYQDRPAGSFGRVGVFSFNGNKIVTTSGGGAIVSDDTDLISRCRHLATQAREPELHYEHREIGFNYRMSNILAAIGRAQLASLDERVTARRRTYDTYVELLGGYDGVTFMPEADGGRSNRWLTTLTVNSDRFGASNHDIIAVLEADNIEARPVWKPMHLQPAFTDARMFGGGVAEHLFDEGFCLPSGTQMTGDDIVRVCDIVSGAGGDQL
ncbi:MAG: DegT/DnrJ/EryC1/StrS family aminotransferase, partial [Actinomycetia bacterium]|nr:DegT/DnrJ/EryC1/StrS family aminotransferase [Actinomycetes bacterium]